MLSYSYRKGDDVYLCYMETCAPYQAGNPAEEKIDYNFRGQVVGHLGRLATRFSGVDLSETRSMWSIIALSPFDTDQDEKEDNLDGLVETLRLHHHEALAASLIHANHYHRAELAKHLHSLPCCVYQGDLNDSNILRDKAGQFKGIIDFNMFGTEVNINCFLNETMYYLTQEDFEALTAQEIVAKMQTVQEKMLAEVFKRYTLNDLEREMWGHYKKLIDMAFFPNVMLMKYLLNHDIESDKVLEVIRLILEG